MDLPRIKTHDRGGEMDQIANRIDQKFIFVASHKGRRPAIEEVEENAQ